MKTYVEQNQVSGCEVYKTTPKTRHHCSEQIYTLLMEKTSCSLILTTSNKLEGLTVEWAAIALGLSGRILMSKTLIASEHLVGLICLTNLRPFCGKKVALSRHAQYKNDYRLKSRKRLIHNSFLKSSTQVHTSLTPVGSKFQSVTSMYRNRDMEHLVSYSGVCGRLIS